MKTLIFFAFLTNFALAQHLEDEQRDAILKELEKIQEKADSSVESKFRIAFAAFNTAIASDSAAYDLYLKCEEKVNFTDMHKKQSEFREWKKNNSDRLGEAAFKTALRQQLRWLVLTMQASAPRVARDKLANEASKILESIMSQAEKIHTQQDILKQNVTASVFARAYNLSGLKVEHWPLSPLAIPQIYDQVILPPLRSPQLIPQLAEAWKQRQMHEGMLAKEWTGRSDKKPRDGENTPEYEKFITETLPQLKWQAEIDLFQAGDQQKSANRMLDIIRDNISHDKATEWSEQLKNLVQAKTNSP